jgi:uncharacterized membrane protein YhaH (DUF805 family)
MMIMQAILDAAKKTLVYRGRAERLEHWAFAFFTAVMVVVVLLLNKFLGTVNSFPINWAVLFLGIWLILANVSLMVRRLHDHNFSGFLLFLPLISVTIWLFGYDQMTEMDRPFISPVHAGHMMSFGKWSLVSTLIVFASFFARPGDKDANKFGDPS